MNCFLVRRSLSHFASFVFFLSHNCLSHSFIRSPFSFFHPFSFLILYQCSSSTQSFSLFQLISFFNHFSTFSLSSFSSFKRNQAIFFFSFSFKLSNLFLFLPFPHFHFLSISILFFLSVGCCCRRSNHQTLRS